ncbi:MAG: hypothetical protein OXI54_09690 [Chloroflexota bacterium]|nr:hypothetical protein [Chloroflexota bacterium]MDE2684406.1 hypothetical protein [Chloroflexota bacterium]
MNTYRWTKRIGIAGIVFLAAIALFVTVVSILGIRVAGIYPEAFRLAAMMTAPFTLGLVAVSTLGAALVETVLRLKRRPAGA